VKALVTGATGFVGSHLAEALGAKGCEVHCLVRPTSDLKWLRGLNVRLAYGALSDRRSLAEAVSGKDCVFHCAAVTKTRRPEQFFEVNAQGTRNVLAACKERNPTVGRIIYVSSQAAAGPSPDGTPATEERPCRPVSLYGKSKYEGELAVADFASQLPTTIIRPSAVYGPRDRDMLIFFQLASCGIFPLVGSRKGRVSLIHVNDLAQAIILVAESRQAVGQTYFAADPRPYDLTEAGALIAQAVGRKCRTVRIPIFVAWALAHLARIATACGAAPIAFNPDKIRELSHPFWVCSTEKIASTVDFKPRYSLSEGLIETARWYRENGLLR